MTGGPLILRWNIHLILQSIRPIQVRKRRQPHFRVVLPQPFPTKPRLESLPATSSAAVTTATCDCYSPVVLLGTVSQASHPNASWPELVYEVGEPALTLFLYILLAPFFLFPFLRLVSYSILFLLSFSLDLEVAVPCAAHLVLSSLVLIS